MSRQTPLRVDSVVGHESKPNELLQGMASSQDAHIRSRKIAIKRCDCERPFPNALRVLLLALVALPRIDRSSLAGRLARSEIMLFHDSALLFHHHTGALN